MVLAQTDNGLKWITREEYTSGNHVGANYGKVSGRDNPNAKHIQIFNEEGTLQFDCEGTFKSVCITENLPHVSLRKSHVNGGVKIFQTKRQLAYAKSNQFEKFIGWYAKQI